MYSVSVGGALVVLVEGANMWEADDAFARLLGKKDFKRLGDLDWLFALGYTVEKLDMIYATPFDNKTKQTTGPSSPMHVETLAEAEKLIPALVLTRTKNTLIYEGLCLSHISFSI